MSSKKVNVGFPACVSSQSFQNHVCSLRITVLWFCATRELGAG